jgi:hypothetical protein
MSERSGTKAFSVYLSPRAVSVLNTYVTNSGYGSTSRTIEEILLAYDSIYGAWLSALYTPGIETILTNPQAMSLLFGNLMNNFKMRNGTPLEKAAMDRTANELKKNDPGQLFSGKYGTVG